MVRGWLAAVDLETATTFAVARHFGMDSLAVHFAFDNPRRKRHILLAAEDDNAKRKRGNERMIELTFDILREYLRRHEV